MESVIYLFLKQVLFKGQNTLLLIGNQQTKWNEENVALCLLGTHHVISCVPFHCQILKLLFTTTS